VLVLIVDPARPSRFALRAQLERRGVVTFAEAEDVRAAVRAAVRLHPDVCLVDTAVAEPAREAIAAIHEAAPELPVVMVSASPNDAEGLEAATAGAAGYLGKRIPSRALAAALTDVVAGGSAFPRRLQTVMVAALRERSPLGGSDR
jgi:DNA-binding NarL/FixJ family response regulator